MCAVGIVFLKNMFYSKFITESVESGSLLSCTFLGGGNHKRDFTQSRI